MSRIHVSARIRQSFKGESGEKLKLPQQNDGSSEGFDHVFENSKKCEELYTSCISHLVKPFLNGVNASVVIMGERNSGQISTIFGGEIGNIFKSSKNSSGFLAPLVHDLFRRPIDVGGSSEKPVLKLSVVQVKGNKVEDLLVPPGETQMNGNGTIGFVENEFEGLQLKNVIELEVIGTKDCSIMIEGSLEKVGLLEEEDLSDKEDSTLMIQFQMQSNKNVQLTSWLRIFKLPGVEKLMNTPPDKNTRPHTSSLDVHAFGNVVLQLTDGDENIHVPNYSETVLTTLLSDALGGNCLTSCIVTFKPNKTPASAIVLRYGLRLKKIINYPTQNTSNFKNILRRYRWLVKRMQSKVHEDRQKNEAYIDELKKKIAALENKMKEIEHDKVEWQAEKNDAENRLANANRKYADLTSSRTEISSRMVSSEQEKLKLSKEIVDLQLLNNAIKQEAEKQIFDLRQQNLVLEGKASDMERSLALEKRGHQDQKERATHFKQEHQDLSEEYINLKGNHASLSEEHQAVINENETLKSKIAKLVDAKEQMIKYKDQTEMQQLQDLTEQLKMITEQVSQESKQRKTSSSMRLRSSIKKLDLEKQLLLNVQEREEKLDSLREEHKMELKKLGEKLMAMREELKESNEQAERYKMRMAEQNSELLIANEQKTRNEDLVQKLDEKLKDLSLEYCKRLETYIFDLKGFLWNQQGEKRDQTLKDKVDHIDSMMEGLKKGYNTDKEMLENRLKRTVTYSLEILQRHEQLLTAYKLILWKTGVGGSSENNIERDFDITLPPIEEIKNEQIKEKNDLKTKLYLSEQNVKDLQDKVDKLKDKLKAEGTLNERRDDDGSGLSLRALRRNMHDFTVNIQVELEKERAELITRCTLAEQQVAEYEDYMDTYVKRYQQEIISLRKMLAESGRLQSADGVLGLEHRPTRMLPPLQNDRPYRLQQRNSRY
ncbi:coiled-coil domain-containing protein 78-like [Rhopilema esculentum]|uniref:coiled-coil domain-containing protein 78-like n=1 Tax=Rhopilema esculentum TaxID=499914 RepID=UPI0031D554AF|eukprot:gene4561-20820_t